MPQRFSVPITCRNCKASGVVIWEESASNDRTRGPQRQLIAVYGDFHRESGRTRSGDPLIVCSVCDEIQPD